MFNNLLSYLTFSISEQNAYRYYYNSLSVIPQTCQNMTYIRPCNLTFRRNAIFKAFVKITISLFGAQSETLGDCVKILIFAS